MHILFTLLLLCALGDIVMSIFPTPEEIKKFVDVCMTEHKANKQNFVDFGAEKLKTADVPESMKCTMRCYMEKLGYFDIGKTELNIKVYREILGQFVPADVVEKSILACKDMKGNNLCDTGFQIMNCMWRYKVMQGSWIVLTGKTSF